MTDTTAWQPYDGVYPLREEGWLMASDKPQRDPVITEILEKARTKAARDLADSQEAVRSLRNQLTYANDEAQLLTQRLDAIEAELGVGAFEEVSA